LVLAEVFHRNGRKRYAAIFDKVTEYRLIVVPNEKDFFDFGHFGNGAHAMLDYGMACDFEERFWDVEGKRAKARASRWASDLYKSSTIVIEEFWKVKLTRITAFVVFCPLVCLGRMGTSRDAIARVDQRFGPTIVAKKGVDFLAQRIFVKNVIVLETKFRGEPRNEDIEPASLPATTNGDHQPLGNTCTYDFAHFWFQSKNFFHQYV